MTIDIKKIQETCKNFNNSEDAIKAKKKSLQSTKTRLNKLKGRADYDQKMAEVLEQIETLNQCLNYLNPKEKFVTQFEQSDVDKLDFDQTQKAIKSIQSAICNNQFNQILLERYKNIEEMLKEHKETVKPVADSYIRKTELEAVINAVETAEDATREQIIKMLKNLL